MKRLIIGIMLWASGLWLAGNAVLGVLVAPALFGDRSTLSADDAGNIFGDLIGHWSSVTLVFAAIIFIGGLLFTINYWRQQKRLRCGIVLAGLLVVSVVKISSHVVIQETRYVRQQEEAATTAAVRRDYAQRFATYHQLSEQMMKLETILALLTGLTLIACNGRGASGAGTTFLKKDDLPCA